MKSIKKNYLYNSLFQLLMLIVPIITTPYLARIIGAEGIGVYTYYYSIASYFVLIIKLGIDNYGNRAIAENKNNNLSLNGIFSELYIFQALIGVIVSIVYFVFVLFFSQELSYGLLFYLIVFGACIDINWVLYGLEEFRKISIRNLIVKAASTILIFCLIKSNNDIFLYCLILVVSNTVSFALAWPIVLKRIKFVKIDTKNIIRHLKPNLMLFLTVLSVNIYKTMDKIMLGAMMSNKMDVGFYETSERIINIPSILVVSLGTVMMPRISNMIALKDESYKTKIFSSIVFSMIISSSLAFGIMGVSKEFVPIFYGAGFEKNQILYLILLPCCIFMGFSNVIRTQYLLPNHRDTSFLISGIVAACINLILNFFFIPQWGAVGAAVATLVSEITGCICQSFDASKELNLRKYVLYSAYIVTAAIIMFFVIYFPSYSFCDHLLVKMLLKICIGAFIFSALVMLMFFRAYRKKDMDIVNLVTKIKINKVFETIVEHTKSVHLFVGGKK